MGCLPWNQAVDIVHNGFITVAGNIRPWKALFEPPIRGFLYIFLEENHWWDRWHHEKSLKSSSWALPASAVSFLRMFMITADGWCFRDSSHGMVVRNPSNCQRCDHWEWRCRATMLILVRLEWSWLKIHLFKVHLKSCPDRGHPHSSGDVHLSFVYQALPFWGPWKIMLLVLSVDGPAM